MFCRRFIAGGKAIKKWHRGEKGEYILYFPLIIFLKVIVRLIFPQNKK